jgi:hypothetical protein
MLTLIGEATPRELTGISDSFIQYGVLGAVALMGLWFVLTSYRREVNRADKAEEELRLLNQEMRDKVIPALTEATRVALEYAQRSRDRR